MSDIFNDVSQAIGRTPLVRLNRIGKDTGATFYAKLEYTNPGHSVKDRIAVQIIDDAERKGTLKPGGTIIECTSGNTGMGLAMVGAARGYRMVFVMPDKVSGEKIKALRAFGAKVVTTPTAVARGRWRLVTSGGKEAGGLYTVILKRLPEGWRIVHDHSSAE